MKTEHVKHFSEPKMEIVLLPKESDVIVTSKGPEYVNLTKALFGDAGGTVLGGKSTDYWK